MSNRPRRLLVGSVIAVAVLGGLLLAGVSPAALVPRTVTGWLVVAAVAAVLVLWSRVVVPRLTRRGWLRAALRAVPVLAVAAAVLVPATVDREVSEALLDGVPPVAPAPGGNAGGGMGGGMGGGVPGVAAAEPERLSAGELVGVGHVASGQAVVYRSGESTFVRLAGIEVQGAVDVFVWLVPGEGQTEPDGGVDLGPLKGTVGDANYLLPAGVDPADHRTVLLWCRAFSTPIAVAVQS